MPTQQEMMDILQRKADFVRKCGAHDIVHDIDTLVAAVQLYKQKEDTEGFITEADKRIIAAMRHQSQSDHKYSPKTCGLCEETRQVMTEIKQGKL